MSLKAEYKPFEKFLQQGRNFIESPGAISGMEFDDAVVSYKRYVISQLHDEELSFKLNDLGKAVRNQEMELPLRYLKRLLPTAPPGSREEAIAALWARWCTGDHAHRHGCILCVGGAARSP